MSSLLGQGEVPFRWAEPEFIQVSSSLRACTLLGNLGMFPPGSQAGTRTCFFQPHLQLLEIWQSQLLRTCGHRHFLRLELVAELRDGTALCHFPTSLEEQLVQGCRLAQGTLTNRLLILAVIFKKFHPCCIPGCHKALMFHQPQRDPPASKGSFPLGDSRTVFFSKASSQHNALHRGRGTVSLSSLLL